MMTWSRRKFSVVGQLGYIERPCPRTSNPLRLKCGDIRVRTRGDLTAVMWKDKRDVCLLTNIHDPPREGNYCDEHGNAIKPAIVADYNRHMGHVGSADRMANSYSASLLYPNPALARLLLGLSGNSSDRYGNSATKTLFSKRNTS